MVMVIMGDGDTHRADGAAKGTPNGKGGKSRKSSQVVPKTYFFLGAASLRRKMDLMGWLEDGGDDSGDDEPSQLGSSGALQPAGKKPRRTQAGEGEPCSPPKSLPWIRLPDGAAFCMENSMPPEALIVQHGAWLAQSGLLSGAGQILAGLVQDVAADVEVVMDPGQGAFPEVAKAVKDVLGDEVWVAIAISKSRGQWGVGVATKGKLREQAAKLALCIALVAEASNFQELCRHWPALVPVCHAAGIETGMPVPDDLNQLNSNAAVRGELAGPVSVAKPAITTTTIRQSQDGSIPRDIPLWIDLSGQASPAKIPELPMGETLVICTEGKTRKGVYAHAEAVLAQCLTDPATEVEYHDDPHWTEFPMIGKALKKLGDKEECLMVATCPSQGVWAIGVGNRQKNRSMAAKGAIAATLAMHLNMDVSQFDGMGEFVEEARTY